VAGDPALPGHEKICAGALPVMATILLVIEAPALLAVLPHVHGL
jgi:hypothetical protein